MGTMLSSLQMCLSDEVYRQALAQKEQGKDPVDFLLRERLIPAEQLLSALSAFYDMPSILLSHYEIDPAAVARLPEETARRFNLIPLFMMKDRLFVAVEAPMDTEVADYLHQQTGLMVEEVVTTKESIENAINRYYLAGEQTARKVESIASKTEKKEERAAGVIIENQQAPSVEMVDHIISTAIRLKASDIHLEPFEEKAMLRYRIDGVLREYQAPPLSMLKEITARIKIISNLNITEKRMPQDGRCSFKLDSTDYDLRVSIMPNLFGESVVIRVLNTGSQISKLADLAFPENLLNRYRKLITRPHGMLLVTGPTGSGKSTTLYATLREILTVEKKILTLEDPVESKIIGVTQFQMNPQIGYTFAHALRSVLRHDPEVVLVGEIRDLETAEIAIRASLTGHMLFSTLHTNDAPSAAMRLVDMGVPGYMVMSSLIGVLAQRLVRKLCPECRAPITLDENRKSLLGISEVPPDAQVFKPVGCTRCEHIGYRGRAAIYELLEIVPEMRKLSAEEMTAERIRRIAGEHDFISLRRSALEKLYSGVTGMDEILKLTVEE